MNHELESHLRELPQPFLLMGVGVPGAHKSHLLKPLADSMQTLYLNPTDMRKNHMKLNQEGKMLKDAWSTNPEQEQGDDVWDILQDHARQYLELNGSVIFDATNWYSEKRKEDVKQFRRLGAQSVVAAYFAVDLEVMHQRLINYEGTVKRANVTKMHHLLTEQPPTIKEDFDAIYTLDANKPDFPIIKP